MRFGSSCLPRFSLAGHGGYSLLLYFFAPHGHISVSGTTPRNMLFKDETPQVLKQNFLRSRYSRQERRHNAFVFKNNANGLYIRMTETGGKRIFEDVPLSEASGFKFISLSAVASLIPQVDISVQMAYIDKQTRKICVR